jgi:hypothetical protein
MNFRLPFLRKRKPSWHRVIGGFFVFSRIREFINRHRYHHRTIAYFGGFLIGLSGFTVVGLQALPIASTDVLAIPSQYNNPVRMAATQQQLHSYLWYPMRVCYPEAPCSALQTNVPVGWPNSSVDSNIIRDSGTSNVIWGVLPLYGASTPADPNIVALLDWAASVGMKVNLDDEISWWYISKNVYNTTILDAHIKRLVQLYGSHPTATTNTL